MTDKNMYLIGVRILDELCCSYSPVEKEEQAAIKTARSVLSRLYAKECLDDINCGLQENNSRFLEYFCEETIDRIVSYNKGADTGLEEFMKRGRMINESK